MNIRYDNLENILKSDEFINEYDKYLNHIKYDKLINFLDNIENNKNYYHLNVNKKNIYKKSENNDTIILKNIINLINKITDNTFDNIKIEIIKLINDKKYLHSMIIENIIEISITNSIYKDLGG